MKTGLQVSKFSYPYKEVGFRIRNLREANGYTRDALAARIEISTKFLYEIEMGKKGFSAEVLFRLSQKLAISTDYLLTGVDGSVGSRGCVIPRKMVDTIKCFSPYQMGNLQKVLQTMQEMCTMEKQKHL